MTLLARERIDRSARDDLGLEELLSPVPVERFLAEYWERRYLVVERGAPGYYDRLFTLEDVDRILHVARSCTNPAVTLGPPRGTDRARVRAAAAEVSPREVYRAFCEGYSMRVGGVHRFWPALSAFQADLSESLSAGISVELYLTPASTQGVNAHYDNRDAFILQIYGSKRWHLGEPEYELPGLGVDRMADRIPSQLIANDSPHLAESVVLRAGDLLYLPRGFYHQPVAESETSLHLSVVVYPLGWADFLARAIELVALRHLPLRRSLPPGFAADPGTRAGMAETFSELVEAFCREAPFEETLDTVVRERRPGEPHPGPLRFAT